MLKLVSAVLWPSFLAAIVAEGVFFSLFDPQDLAQGGVYADLSPLGVYTIGFFLFWLLCALASWLTWYLCHEPENGRRLVSG